MHIGLLTKVQNCLSTGGNLDVKLWGKSLVKPVLDKYITLITIPRSYDFFFNYHCLLVMLKVKNK